MLLPYKGACYSAPKLSSDGRICSVVVPWDEIETYSPLYNPTMLVMEDMRMTEGVDVAIGYKVYKDGKVTAKIRSNYERTICADLAAHFGGGGHQYAAGFKIKEKTDIEDLKNRVNAKAAELLDALKGIMSSMYQVPSTMRGASGANSEARFRNQTVALAAPHTSYFVLRTSRLRRMHDTYYTILTTVTGGRA